MRPREEWSGLFVCEFVSVRLLESDYWHGDAPVILSVISALEDWDDDDDDDDDDVGGGGGGQFVCIVLYCMYHTAVQQTGTFSPFVNTRQRCGVIFLSDSDSGIRKFRTLDTDSGPKKPDCASVPKSDSDSDVYLTMTWEKL